MIRLSILLWLRTLKGKGDEYADESIEEGFIDKACFLLERAYIRSDGEARPLRDFVEGPAKDDLAEMILGLMANQACE